ncbi:fatty acid desaturase [Ammoniphilus sp. CFH 90114]|uniref:fatty acid desaturase family protein n=1 Tax=Ammoniphilus sp. CFH 90114 TaxID=2493665 RepID=UPI00100F9446|nr:acyl-CoA desaturase [Ammoniphilus sp. CFH 90114]
MKELKSYGWYAARISPLLPEEAFKPVPTRLWGGLAYLLITVAGFLIIGLIEPPLWVSLIISVIVGLCFAGLGLLGHEILHGTVVRKAWLRDFLGAIAFWPLTTGPQLWRNWHNMNHHIYTQDEHRDPDAWLSKEQLAKYPLLIVLYKLPLWVRATISFVSLSFSFTLHSARMFFRSLKNFHSNKKPKVWIQFILPWATWISLLFFMGPVKWLLAFLIPLFIGNFIVMSYISTNHRLNPLVTVNDPLANSLTVTVPKWVDFLHFNFSYHTEHHLFPGISPKYYPLVKQHILNMWPERYHQMPLVNAMIALLKTPRIYYEETELVDPNHHHLYGTLGHGLDLDQYKYRVEGEAYLPTGTDIKQRDS